MYGFVVVAARFSPPQLPVHLKYMCCVGCDRLGSYFTMKKKVHRAVLIIGLWLGETEVPTVAFLMEFHLKT